MIAADCAPQIHVVAIHAEAKYNNSTPGIGVLCELPDNKRLAVGTYYNSYYRQSVYAAVVWQPLRLGELKAGPMAGPMAGLATGYRLQVRHTHTPAHGGIYREPAHQQGRAAPDHPPRSIRRMPSCGCAVFFGAVLSADKPHYTTAIAEELL